MAVGILAYGSLISKSGSEIGLVIRRQVPMKTQFKVEFARSSTGRNGAPTLVPVSTGGDYVNAVLLILDSDVSLKDAYDKLFRREADRIGTGEEYVAKPNPGINDIVIEELPGAHGADQILYTRICAQIYVENRTPTHLAELAIESARGKAGLCGKDGITYLRDAKNAGIETPLSGAYESEILKKTGTSTLNEAIEKMSKRRSR